MNCLFVTQELESYILDLAEEYKLHQSITSGSNSFSFKHGFSGEITIDSVVRESVVELSVKTTISQQDFSGTEIEDVISGVRRELRHIIIRTFPGSISQTNQTAISGDNNLKHTYELTFTIDTF